MRKLFLILVLIAATLAAHSSAQAAPAAKQPLRGVTLSPAIVNQSIQTSEAQHEIDFQLTNNESVTQSVNLSTRDFNTLNETGGLFFVGANPTELQKKYGLANWLSLPQTHFVMAPKQTIGVKILVLNLPSLAPGGHYGAMMVSLTSGNSSTGHNQVSLQPIASALLFVNKVGGALYHLKLSSVYAQDTLWKLPSRVTLRFQNTGNSHLIPRGTVDVYGPGGKLVKHGVINDSSGIILPETARRYDVDLAQVMSASAPGKYKLIVNWRFDSYHQSKTFQTSFYYMTPLSLVVPLLTLSAAILILRKRLLANKSR